MCRSESPSWCRRGVLLATIAAALVAATSAPVALAAPPRRAVKALVREARALAEKQVWHEAASRYLDAHALVPDAVLLFNAARCLEMAKEVDDALAHFTTLLARDDVDPDLREKAEARHRALSAVVAARRAGGSAPAVGDADAGPGEPAADQPVAHATESASTEWVAGWATVGSGLALVATGGALLGIGAGRYDDGARADTYARARALQDEGDTFHAAGWATLGIGLAASVAGSVVLILDATSGADDETASFFATPVAGGGLIGFISTF